MLFPISGFISGENSFHFEIPITFLLFSTFLVHRIFSSALSFTFSGFNIGENGFRVLFPNQKSRWKPVFLHVTPSVHFESSQKAENSVYSNHRIILNFSSCFNLLALRMLYASQYGFHSGSTIKIKIPQFRWKVQGNFIPISLLYWNCDGMMVILLHKLHRYRKHNRKHVPNEKLTSKCKRIQNKEWVWLIESPLWGRNRNN